jgi:hypothetical protein
MDMWIECSWHTLRSGNQISFWLSRVLEPITRLFPFCLCVRTDLVVLNRTLAGKWLELPNLCVCFQVALWTQIIVESLFLKLGLACLFLEGGTWLMVVNGTFFFPRTCKRIAHHFIKREKEDQLKLRKNQPTTSDLASSSWILLHQQSTIGCIHLWLSAVILRLAPLKTIIPVPPNFPGHQGNECLKPFFNLLRYILDSSVAPTWKFASRNGTSCFVSTWESPDYWQCVESRLLHFIVFLLLSYLSTLTMCWQGIGSVLSPLSF